MVDIKNMEPSNRTGIRKRKHKTKITTSEPKNMKLHSESPNVKKINLEITKLSPMKTKPAEIIVHQTIQKGVQELKEGLTLEDRFPDLNNHDLVQKFLNVPMTNNQKGRIRQLLKDSLKGTSQILLPDVIHNRIQNILKTKDLSDSDLRKLRILYNMLKTTLKTEEIKSDTQPKKVEGKKKTEKKNKEEVKNKLKEKSEHVKSEGEVKNKQTKEKGIKRYVVFVGNLPLETTKEMMMEHFIDLAAYIKDIRIPKRPEDKNSCIAYVELSNEPSYQLALSKHHSMLGNKRINVLYTAQKKGKVPQSVVKSKRAKLVALQKSGQLIGSVPLNRKRSQRRKKMKQARAKEAAE